MEEEIKVSKWLPWVAAIAFFMQSLDGTILNTALPSIAHDLNKSPLKMQPIIIAYVLTLALLIPLSGWLSDKFGSRNIFTFAVGIFTLGSLACVFCTSLEALVYMRILQAIGGSMMVPVSRLALLYTYPKDKLLKVINFITIPGLIGPVIGPTLGGWLVHVASWHWIFLINIPIGVAGMILAWKFIPNYKRTEGKFDFIGFLLLSLGLVLISLSLEFAGNRIISLNTVFLVLFVGIILIVLYIVYSQKVSKPLINLKLFKIRTLRIGIIGNIITRLGVGGIPLMLPLLLQVGFGKNSVISGAMLIFSAVATILAKSSAIPLIKHFGYKKLLIYNTIILGVAITLFMFPNENTPLVWLIPILIAYGAFNSIQMSAMNSISLADLTPKDASGGNTMFSVTQQLSMSFGISLSAMLFNSYEIFENNHVITAFKLTFLTLGIITILSAFTFAFLKNDDGTSMSGN
ncbi:DHA2 family efflux MFS transporter permease subunit [Apibacter muscae]|uniref:DHA2 family efflux MFS transporter permease subunit n=1 Tax=Apibacter muscae TaxID=2509004 RepID=UPI0011ACF23E|nr:DHA2 family efflux MFS transporter permease subunit [Apibacter muscae]TWP22920.1 DHA2 family efflux MFS transporter permease subunit [Apibacter muscae]